MLSIAFNIMNVAEHSELYIHTVSAIILLSIPLSIVIAVVVDDDFVTFLFTAVFLVAVFFGIPYVGSLETQL